MYHNKTDKALIEEFVKEEGGGLWYVGSTYIVVDTFNKWLKVRGYNIVHMEEF